MQPIDSDKHNVQTPEPRQTKTNWKKKWRPLQNTTNILKNNQGGKYLFLKPFQAVVVQAMYHQTCAGCFPPMPCSALSQVQNYSDAYTELNECNYMITINVDKSWLWSNDDTNILIKGLLNNLQHSNRWRHRYSQKHVEYLEDFWPWPSLMICFVTLSWRTSTSESTFGGPSPSWGGSPRTNAASSVTISLSPTSPAT